MASLHDTRAGTDRLTALMLMLQDGGTTLEDLLGDITLQIQERVRGHALSRYVNTQYRGDIRSGTVTIPRYIRGDMKDYLSFRNGGSLITDDLKINVTRRTLPIEQKKELVKFYEEYDMVQTDLQGLIAEIVSEFAEGASRELDRAYQVTLLSSSALATTTKTKMIDKIEDFILSLSDHRDKWIRDGVRREAMVMYIDESGRSVLDMYIAQNQQYQGSVTIENGTVTKIRRVVVADAPLLSELSSDTVNAVLNHKQSMYQPTLIMPTRVEQVSHSEIVSFYFSMAYDTHNTLPEVSYKFLIKADA